MPVFFILNFGVNTMAKKDTTSTGVSDENDVTDQDAADNSNLADDKEKTLSGRDEMMNEIVARAKAVRESEEPGDQETTTETDDALDDTDKTDKDDTEGDEDLETVKVDGETFHVSKKEVEEAGGISAYQKEKAASNRLREAAMAKQQLQQEREQFEREKAAYQAPAPESENKPSDDTDADEDQAQILADKLYSGDEDQAREAIKTILEGRNKIATQADNDKMTPEQIVAQATAQAEWNLERKLANDDFAAEYSDINAKPMLRKLANDETIRLRNEHPDWGPRKIIMQAGENVRESFKEQLSVGGDEMDKRRNRKRAMDNVSGATGKVAQKPEPKPKTKSEIVAGMNARRSHSTI